MNSFIETQALMTSNNTISDTFAGGTIVFLNKNTTIESAYNSRKKQHIVTLSGEAFFDIHKKQEEQFFIQTQGIFIEDIGTAFNVKSYASATQIEIVVQHGEV